MFFLILYTACVLASDLEYPNSLKSLLHHKSDCSKEALQEAIPICINYGSDHLTPEISRLLAVKLAICEFEGSHISYPSSCNQLEYDLDLCILDLKKSPQFWTTFSGYYREVSRICFEASFPYQKDQIIYLYSNITNVYEDLLHNFQESQEDSLKNQVELDSRFKEMFQYITKNYESYKKQTEEANQKYDEYQKEMDISKENALGSMKNVYETFDSSFDFLGGQLEHLMTTFNSLEQYVADLQLDEEIEDLKNSYLRNINEMGDESELIISLILAGMEGIDIVTVKNYKQMEVLSTNLEFSNELAVEVGRGIQSNQDLIAEQAQVIMDMAADFFLNYTEMILNEMDQYLKETSEKIERMVNGSFTALEVKINATVEQIEEINEISFDLRKTSERINSFINATRVSMNKMTELSIPFKQGVQTYITNLLFVPKMIIIAISVLLSGAFLLKFYSYVPSVSAVVSGLLCVVFLALFTIAGVSLNNLYVAFNEI